MRKFIILMIVLFMSTSVHATLTYDGTYYRNHISQARTGTSTDPIYLAIEEIESDLDSIVAGAADTLDATYNAGSTIDVDTDAVTLTVSDGDNNAALAIVQNDSTNDPDAMTITSAADAATAVGLQIDCTAGYDIQGTGDVWNISTAGAITCVGITSTGAITTASALTVTASDVLFDDTYDLQWDTSEDTLVWKDNAVAGFGNTGAAPDVEMKWDADSWNFTSAAADTPWEIGGTTAGFDITYAFETAGNIIIDYDGDFLGFTDDMDVRFGTGASANGDFQISSNSSNVLSIAQVVADTGTIEVGADGTDIPTKFYGETAGDYFQITGDDVVLEDVSLVIAEGTQIQFGDPVGTGDMVLSCSTNVLAFTQVVADTGSVTFGADGTDIPTKWFGETAGDYFQVTGDDIVVEDMSLCIADGTQIQFGDAVGTGQMYMSISTADLTIGQVVAGTGTLLLGVDNKGIDTTFYAETAGDYLKWDQDGATNLGALIFEDSVLQFAGANVTYSTAISTDALAITATDHANANVTIGAAGGTNSVDLTLYGFTAGNTVVFDGGAETLTLTDVDLNLAVPDATDVGMAVTAGGANTASLVKIDGATGAAAWVGADNTGMLHIVGDGVGADIGSTLLYVANSAQPIAAAEGFLARFVDTGTARPGAYAVEIEVTDTTGGLKVDGHSTFTKGVQASSQALTSTGDGLTTGVTPVGASFCTVTSANADNVITLPDTVVGNIIYYYCAANGFELETPAASDDTINGVDCDGTNQLACAATSLYKCVCVADGVWIVTGEGADGADTGTLTPDAD